MHLSRRFSLPAHGAIELLAGIAMMLAPTVLAFGAAGLIVSASLGAILTGIGLNLSSPRRGDATAWHYDFDAIFLLATAIAALALAIAGQARAAIFMAAIVGVEACLSYATRYATQP